MSGGQGQVSAALCQLALTMDMSVVLVGADHLDLSDLAKINEVVNKHKPKFAINCASYLMVWGTFRLTNRCR